MTARRLRRDAEFWRERVGRWAESGLNAKEFGAREGLRADRLHYWKAELARRTAGSRVAAKTESLAGPTFLPIVLRDAASPQATSFEVVLESGHVVRVPPDFVAEALVRLLTALGGV